MTWTHVADSLNWSIGHSGKGYLLQDGTVKTWNVDPFNPIDHYTVHQRNHESSPSALNFEIDPDGGVVTGEPTTKVQSIINMDPRLYDAGQRPVFEDDFDLDNFEPTPQGKRGPDFNFIMSSDRRMTPRPYHFHPYTGLPCTCFWGQPSDQSRTSSSQYIRQIRNQNQKAFRTPEGEAFLNKLDKLMEEFPDAEAMTPWMANQYKQGHFISSPYADDSRIFHWNHDESLADWIRKYTNEEKDPDLSTSLLNTNGTLLQYGREKAIEELARRHNTGEPQMPQEELQDLIAKHNQKSPKEWVSTAFNPDLSEPQIEALRNLRRNFYDTRNLLPRWQNWMNAGQHPARRGINIMEHNPASVNRMSIEHERALEEAQKKQRWLENYGPNATGRPEREYYEYGNEEGYPQPLHYFGKPYQGWHVIKLTPRQAEGESYALGHCIGNYDDQNYHYNIAKGNIDAYSLRDHEGYPHATWHFNPGGADIGHIQGQSHPLKQDYRDLISQFHEAKGLSDEEGNEARLESPPDRYDESVTVPLDDMDDFVRYENDPTEMAENCAEIGVGEDTQIDSDPNWYDIARDFVSGGSSRLTNRFLEAVKDNDWAQNQLHYSLSQLAASGMENDEREAYNLWNEQMPSQFWIDLPAPEANAVDEYNNTMDAYGTVEPGSYGTLARDYLRYPSAYEGEEYDVFHEHLFGNDHEQGMSDALHDNINWNDPAHVRAINYWNQHWNDQNPDMMVHKDPPYVEERNPYQERLFGIQPQQPEYQPYPEPMDDEYRGYSQHALPGEGDTSFFWSSTHDLWEWDSGATDPIRNWEGLSPMKPIVTQPEVTYQPRNEQEMIYHMIGEAVEEGDYERAQWLYHFLPADLNPMKQASVPEQSILTPAIELQEWLADLGGEPEPPSIHHQTIEDTIQNPSVSPSAALPYYPPAHIPTEVKQSANDGWNITDHPDLYCPDCNNPGMQYWQPDGHGKSEWYCPTCERPPYAVGHGGMPMTGDLTTDKLIYQGMFPPRSEDEDPRLNEDYEDYEEEPAEQAWEEPERRPIPAEHADMDLHCADCGQPLDGNNGYAQEPGTNNFFCIPCVQQRERQEHVGHVIYAWDSPITQADATNDALGKPPALITQPTEDPDYLHDEFCPNCNQIHRPDEPCPDTSVRQYQQQEREWYGRDPNRIHSPDPNNHSEYPPHNSVQSSVQKSSEVGLNERLEEMQEAIVRLASIQSRPEEKKPRKLIINRDENGRMQSIEEA